MLKKRFIKALSAAMSVTVFFISMPVHAIAVSSEDENAAYDSSYYEPPPAEESTELVYVLGEDTEKRDEYTKYFRMSDGSYAAAVYPYAVHYEKNGEMTDISNAIEESAGTSGYYRTENTPAEISLPSSYNTSSPVRYSLDNHTVSFVLNTERSYLKTAASTFTREYINSSYSSAEISQPPQKDTSAEETLLKEIHSQILSEDEFYEIYGSSPENEITAEHSMTSFSASSDNSSSDNESLEKAVEEYNESIMSGYARASQVSYADVLPGVNIEYIIIGDTLKENIIIENKSSVTSLEFLLDCGSLSPEVSSDGAVLLSDSEGNQVFKINSPYMYDSEGAESCDIEVSLSSEGNGKYKYTLIPDNEWIMSEDRVFPVTIDPTLQSDGSSIVDSTGVFSDSTMGFPNSHNYIYSGRFCDSINFTYPEVQAMIKAEIPSQITESARIIGAKMSVAGYAGATGHCAGGLTIGAYTISDNWGGVPFSAVGTSGNANYNKLIDYINVNDSNVNDYNGKWFTFDITSAAQKWHDKNVINRGIALRGINTPSGNYYAGFISGSNQALSEGAPQFTYFYRETKGVEDNWTFTTAGAGRSGAVSVNNFNGAPFASINLISMSGGNMPVSLSFIYNASMTNNPKGNWHTNYNMIITECDIASTGRQYKYKLTDGDGTDHYFYSTTSGKYKDEDGLGLTLTIISELDYGYKIVDKKDNLWKFDHFGRLKYISDPNENYNLITFESMSEPDDIRIKSIKEGNENTPSSERIVQFTYSGEYINISAPDGSYVSMKFVHRPTGNDWKTALPTEISYPDSTAESGKTTINYDQYEYITSISDGYGHVTSVEYAPIIKRVSSISCGSDNDILEKYSFSYGFNETSITDIKNRTVTYQFNNAGQTTGIVDKTTSLGQNYEYGAPGGTAGSENKLLSASKAISPSLGLVPGGDHSNDNSANMYGIFPDEVAGFTKSYDSSKGNTSAGSVKLEKSPSCTSTKYVYFSFPVAGANSYTLSSYVNTAGVDLDGHGVRMVIDLFNSNGYRTGSSSVPVTGTNTNEWKRIQTTINTEAGDSRIHVGLYFDADTAGTVWMDDLQLEKAEGAGSFNLLKNSPLVPGSAGWDTKQSHSGLSDTYVFSDVSRESAAPAAFDYQRNITGDISRQNITSQTVNISGSKNDVFIFGAWSKAKSISMSADAANKPGIPKYSLSIRFYNGNSQVGQSSAVSFNTSTENWQYITGKALAPANYTKVEYIFDYSYNGNSASLAAPFLYKENYGQTYAYDKYGNLESTESLANTKASFAYNDDYLMRSLSPTGSSYVYVRDSAHNIQYAYSSNGQRTDLTYDSAGKATDIKITGLTAATEIDTSKTYNIVNAETGLCLYNGMNSPEISAGAWDSSIPGYKNFKFLHLGENKYKITNTSGDKCIELNSDIDFSLSAISDNDTHQEFQVLPDENGAFYLKSVYSNMCLEYSTINLLMAISSQTGSRRAQWRLIEVTSNDPYMTSSVTYTADGNNVSSATDPRGNTSMYTYDAKGRLIAAEDAAGNTAEYTYDEMNRTKSITSGSASVTYNYYQDQLASINRGNGDVIYSFDYDQFGRNTSVTVGKASASKTLSQNTYTGNLLTRQTYGNGAYYDITYDALDRISAKFLNGVQQSKYCYDRNGNLFRFIDNAAGRINDYTTDLSGRTASVTTTDLSNKLLSETSWSYIDGKNQLASSTVKIYGANNELYKKLKTEPVWGASGEGENPDAVYGVKINDEEVASYTYDKLGRAVSSSLPKAGINYNYTYLDGVNGSTTNVLESCTLESTRNGRIYDYTYDYTYDELGNIKYIFEDDLESEGFDYDELGQLIRYDSCNCHKTELYTYDDNGNLLYKDVYSYNYNDGTNSLSGFEKRITYSYNDNTWADLLTSFDNDVITYDSIGNPLNYRDGMEMTWTAGRRLATLTNDNYEISYTYDADGIRTKKSVTDTATGVTSNYEYIYDGNGLLAAMKKDGVVRAVYLYDASGSPIGAEIDGERYWFEKTPMGDIVRIRDDSNSIRASFIYDAWGFIGRESCQNSNKFIAELIPFRYRGYVYDNETGLYYLNSRYYDPVTSRFVNADGYVSTGTGLMGYNMFSYCNNNPVKRYDPYGQCWRAANGAWCHDNWEYLGGYERKPDPTSPVIAEPVVSEPVVSAPVTSVPATSTPVTQPETVYITVTEPAGAVVHGGKTSNDYPNYENSSKYHGARDISGVPEGTPIYAAFSGIIAESNSHWSYGVNRVIMSTINGTNYMFIYAHMTNESMSIKWDVGDNVNKGDLIGYVGRTGNVTGVHLHLEARVYPYDYQVNNIDPFELFN